MRADDVQLVGIGSGTGTVATASFATTSSYTQPSRAGYGSLSANTVTSTDISGAPTKGTMYIDQRSYRYLGPKVIEVHYQIYSNGNGSNGTGQYLLNLPDSLNFDLSAVGQSAYTGGTADPDRGLGYGYSTFNAGPYQCHAYALIYDSTRFRVAQYVQGNTLSLWGATNGGMTGGRKLDLTFTCTIQ